MELRSIATRSGLRFDAWVEGPADGPPVLLLHGFPQSRHTWRAQVPALAAAGYRAVAPDQRGYSPGARPDPADLASYGYERLIADGVEIADAAGAEGRRFHLVGHDWGGQVAWGIAARHPARLASLTVLSRPHPEAFMAALADDPEQQHRSRHHRAFQDPVTVGLLLADGAKWLRETLAHAGVPPGSIDEYLSVLGTPAALEAAVAWYRSPGGLRIPLGSISVPTLYVWGDADSSVGRMAAELTARYVTGPYRFEVLPGIGHFATDQVPERITALLLEHIARFRG